MFFMSTSISLSSARMYQLLLCCLLVLLAPAAAWELLFPQTFGAGWFSYQDWYKVIVLFPGRSVTVCL